MLHYLDLAGPNNTVDVDGNDTEDYLILFHMSCSSERSLVTGDMGTIQAVSKAIENLRVATVNETLQPIINSRVIGIEEFLREAAE